MQAPRNIRWLKLALLLQVVAASGCANKPYRYGDFWDAEQYQVVVDQGEPHKRLDRMSDIVSWPGRKLRPDLPDRRKIAPETTAKVTEYLAKNELTDVYVSVRDYQPRDQWRRLRDNDVVPPLSRYSLGTLSVLRYSIFPGRVFGRNGYNPYTNTLYVNSDSPALLLHEAAFAKNLHAAKLPGMYVTSSELPFLSVVRHLDAAQDVVGYAKAEADWDLEQESYREVFPRVGAESVGGATAFVPLWGGPLLGLGGAVAGGVAGRTALAQREKERGRELDEIVEGEVTGRVQQASYVEPVNERRPAVPQENRKISSASRGRRAVEHTRER
jgi:hypothetical protein